jgi:hypothetical protein
MRYVAYFVCSHGNHPFAFCWLHALAQGQYLRKVHANFLVPTTPYFAGMPWRQGAAHFVGWADHLFSLIQAALAPLLLLCKHFLCFPYKNVVSIRCTLGGSVPARCYTCCVRAMVVRQAGGELSGANWRVDRRRGYFVRIIQPLYLLREMSWHEPCLGQRLASNGHAE